jgi:hypothetical protein
VSIRRAAITALFRGHCAASNVPARGQKPVKTGKKSGISEDFPEKPWNSCGNRPFSVDFVRPQAALF